jgi:transcriptional activator Myb
MTESTTNCGDELLTNVEEPVASTTKEQLLEDIETMLDNNKGEGALFY